MTDTATITQKKSRALLAFLLLIAAVLVFLAAFMGGVIADSRSAAIYRLNFLAYPVYASVLIFPLIIASIVLAARAAIHAPHNALATLTLVLSSLCVPPTLSLFLILLIEFWSKTLL
ncbi:hypothetical protein ASF88_18850 [Leifsonia sp. Leaf336]|uniref:hypothetical protein n=1 Tax=Leifsonia sp. Leaf336 TaxID=1736341 RepID=UPI000700BAB4|nr:hypothetical protein [Leifsonia sp. Leaf336]KQR51236.1 hypothetical protein ASF88_18850 [Leifsonia sp. Leaf336]